MEVKWFKKIIPSAIIADEKLPFPKGTQVKAEWEETYGYEVEIYDTAEGKKCKRHLVITKIRNKKLNNVPCANWFLCFVGNEWRVIHYSCEVE